MTLVLKDEGLLEILVMCAYLRIRSKYELHNNDEPNEGGLRIMESKCTVEWSIAIQRPECKEHEEHIDL